MNLTVGPLPPAVYWRRRAIVLGGLLLVVLLVVYACSGSSPSDASAQHTPGPTPTSISSTNLLPPIVGSGSPVPSLSPSTASGSPSAPASPTGTPTPSTAVTGVATCTDAQIRVTPVISSTSTSTSKLVHGGTFDLKLKVRNISSTTCRRDVGSVPEELTVTYKNAKIWSSGDCDSTKSTPHDVRTFAPDVEIYAEVKWSSYDKTADSCKKSATPAATGKYELIGRLGTKSATVPFSIVS